jgi:hypothetical protein
MVGVTAASSAPTIIPTPTALFTFDDATAGTTLATNTAITNSGASDTSGAVKWRSLDVTASGISGNGLTNFSTGFWNGGISSASNVSFDTGTGTTNVLNIGPVTLSIWAKNPGTVLPNQDRFVLFGVGNNSYPGNQGLQVWLSQVDETGQRTLNVSLQNWNGGFSTWTSASLTWDADAWYNVALTWNRITGAHGHVELFLTKQTDTFGSPLLSFDSNDTTGSNPVGATVGTTGMVNSPWVYFGGQSDAFNAGVSAGGVLGTTAIIDDAAAWIGTRLTVEQLEANFALHAITGNIPESRALAALCGFAGLVAAAAIAIRRRRRR